MRTITPSRFFLLVPAALAIGCAHHAGPPAPEYGRSDIPFQNPQATQGTQATVPEPMMGRPQRQAMGEAAPPIATEVNNSLAPSAVTVVPSPKTVVAQEALDDEKILSVTQAANTGEIELAKLAQARASDQRVRELADMIVRDHEQAYKKGERVARVRKLVPQDSAISEKVRNDNRLALEQLETKTGPEFNRAYVAAQTDAHRQVLELIDHKLLPSASNSDVKALVRSMRPSIAAHYFEAKSLKDEIAK